MLDAGELAECRAAVEALMTSVATIQRVTTTRNGQGGSASGWAHVGTTPCQVVRKTGRGEAQGDRPGVVVYWLILMPLGTAVTRAHRLVIDGVTYELQDDDLGRTSPFQLGFIGRVVA